MDMVLQWHVTIQIPAFQTDMSLSKVNGISDQFTEKLINLGEKRL
jgi:hypothetical protein